jgi:transposase-like protein
LEWTPFKKVNNLSGNSLSDKLDKSLKLKGDSMNNLSLKKENNKLRLSIGEYFIELTDSAPNEKTMMIIAREIRAEKNNKHGLTFQEISEGLGHDSRQYSNNFYREYQDSGEDILQFLERKNSLKESSFELIERQILASPFLAISDQHKCFLENHPEIAISEATFRSYVSEIDSCKILRRIEKLISAKEVPTNAGLYVKELLEICEMRPEKKKEIITLFPEVNAPKEEMNTAIDFGNMKIQKYILVVFLYACGLSQEIIAILFGVSKSTIHYWTHTLCSSALEDEILLAIKSWSGQVSFDEKWIWINGSWWFVLSAVDAITGFPLLINIYPSLDSISWSLFFKKFKSLYGVPSLIISDGCQKILFAKNFIFPHVRHQLCKFHKIKNLLKKIFEYIKDEALRKRCLRLAKHIFSNKHISSRKLAAKNSQSKDSNLTDYIQKHILNCWRKLTMAVTNNVAERFNRKLEKTFSGRYGIPSEESAQVLIRALWLKELLMNGHKHLEATSDINSINLSRICQEQLNFDNILHFLSNKLSPELQEAA